MQNFTVDTPCGAVQGVQGKNPDTVAFKGIRYAKAERWKYPQQVTHWDGLYKADAFGACSFQPRAFYEEEAVPEKAFYYNEFRRGETYDYSEDCLFLNVWVPKNAANAPVLFYIHGGGFKGGCGHEKHFSGEAFCAQGVIVVTCNYRLGPLGFFSLPALEQEAGHTGNYGLYDQLCALQWVRDNIASFGGNPEQITLMGQSAGAMSVQQHCVSPLSKNLFHRAIMLSGGGASKMLRPCRVQEAFSFCEALADKLGCASDLSCLRSTAPEALLTAYSALCKETKGSMRYCGPMLDGKLLLESPYSAAKNGTYHAIPYLMCTTSEDMMPPILFSMSQKWAALQHTQHKCDSYTAFFSRQLPGDSRGAWHSADLWYVFGTLKNSWRPFSLWDETLSNAMVRYWANFIYTGNPNDNTLPLWKASTKRQKRVMRFGDADFFMRRVSKLKLLHTMLTHPNVGE